MSKVCDGLRGDAFVAAQEVGLDNLHEIVDGTPHGIDTLIRHMREMVFPLTEHESKELFRQCCRTGGPLSRQKGESMKQYPVIHVSEGHRSDMLLDSSGLSREERVTVQASIDNERDFDLQLSSFNIHVYISEKVRNARQVRAKTVSNVEITRTLVGFRRRLDMLAAENLEQTPIMQMSLPLKITVMATTQSN